MFLLSPEVKAEPYDKGVYGDKEYIVEEKKELTFKELVINEFGKDHIMYKIAECESNLLHYKEDGTLVQNPDSTAIGGFQIMASLHEETAKEMNLDIRTPVGNVAYAIYLYNEAQEKPWISSSSCWQSK